MKNVLYVPNLPINLLSPQHWSQQTNDLQGTNKIEDEAEALAAKTPQAELLRWHYRLGHLSFKRVQLLAAVGAIPKKLATITPPKCAGCLYGAMTRRPWRIKTTKNDLKRTVTKPGDCVSVDQLESSSPGFIAQLKGKLTNNRYRGATVYVDQASGLSYVHLQRS